jgi:hypothetical protein
MIIGAVANTLIPLMKQHPPSDSVQRFETGSIIMGGGSPGSGNDDLMSSWGVLKNCSAQKTSSYTT